MPGTLDGLFRDLLQSLSEQQEKADTTNVVSMLQKIGS